VHVYFTVHKKLRNSYKLSITLMLQNVQSYLMHSFPLTE